MNDYANMLKKGYGIPKNPSEAVRYYKMAADKGNSNAMKNYANMLKRGEGIRKNPIEAVCYYKKSIEVVRYIMKKHNLKILTLFMYYINGNLILNQVHI